MIGVPSQMPVTEATAYVHSLAQKSGSSFLSAMRILPRGKRLAMYALYSFCRDIDDIADDPGDPLEKRRRLEEWRREIERLYDGAPTHPISVALSGPVAEFSLRKPDFLALIDGMEMDADRTVRLRDMDELTLYCDRVACAVGRHSIRIFGVPPPEGDPAASTLGQALQMTNILRDLMEDARRDRIYLPSDRLTAHGITDKAHAPAVLAHANLSEVCNEMASVAEDYFDQAKRALAKCDRRAIRPAVIMMETYHRIFVKLRERGWTALDQAVRVSKLEKAWIAVRYGFV